MIIKTAKTTPDPDNKVEPKTKAVATQSPTGQTARAAAVALEPHPLSAIFPELDGEAFADLVGDIRRNGVRDPITLLEGKILDGRNRYRAAIEAGVECPTEQHSGYNPLGFVISKNLKRRHLTESQRAMVAANIANMRQGERTDLEPSANLPKVSQADAAKRLNVSERSVRSASAVKEKAVPELVAAVEAGKVSVAAGGAVAQLNETAQHEIVAKGAEAVKAAAKNARLVKQGGRKMPKVTDVMLTELNHLAGHCRDVPSVEFLSRLATDTKRQTAVGSMRIVHDWVKNALPNNSEKRGL